MMPHNLNSTEIALRRLCRMASIVVRRALTVGGVAFVLGGLTIRAAAEDTSSDVSPFAEKLKLVGRYEKAVPSDTVGATATTAAVKPHQGVPALWINDQPVFPMAMVPIGHFPRGVCRDFAAAGVHLYSHIIWNNRVIVPTPVSPANRTDISWWHGPGQYDFSIIDAQFQAIIDADPQAYIFPRLKLNPPQWWLDAHPDELTQYEDGTHGPQYSIASEVWAATYERMLRDLIRHIERSPYAGHIIGYQPAGGESSEWFWWGFRKGWVDYSPAARNRFRKWLSEQYHGDVSQLRKVWNHSDVTFETAKPPSGQLREATEYLLFRDAHTARSVIDFQRFLSDVTAHNIIKSCRICKEETNGKKIAGVFYGYSIYAAPGRLAVWNSGWLGLRQVLESPYVDFLCAPTDYARRRGGDPGTFISAYTASYRLHNKLYWDEADFRTHLFKGRDKVAYATRSLDETLETLRRGFGYMLTKGTALWWFTLAGDDTFHQNEIMNDIARMKGCGDASMTYDKGPFHEVAVLVDEESFYHMRAGVSELTRPLIYDMHQLSLPTVGAPFDTYLLSDIAKEKMPDYKLYIFLNPFAVNDAVREAIKRKVRRNGAVSVFFYAPGFIQEDGTFSEEAMHDLTGIRVRHEAEQRELRLEISDVAHPITSEAKQSGDSVKTKKLGPVFFADDPEATVLGRLEHNGAAALVVRDFGQWRSVYCASPAIPNAILRGILRYAGVHIYSTTDDTFSANKNYLMLHTATAGRKQIQLPSPRDVYEVLGDRLLGRNLGSIDVELPVGVTRIYRLAVPDGPQHLMQDLPSDDAPVQSGLAD